MTNTQLKIWRKKAGLTQSRAADKFFTGLRQYQNWESGDSPVPKLVEKIISEEGKKK